MLNKEILTILYAVRNSCLEAINEEWDKSDEGFEAMINDLETIIKEIERKTTNHILAF